MADVEKETGKETLNQKVATVVTNMTGNMWFFWCSLTFILVLRISKPPTGSQLLLDVENDLQLLLLAANAVVSAKQSSALKKILTHIDKEADHIEHMDEQEEHLLETDRHPQKHSQ